jgi:hypothetical protein
MLGILTFTSMGNFAHANYNTFLGGVNMSINLVVSPIVINPGQSVVANFDWNFGPFCISAGEFVIDFGDGTVTPRPDLGGCSGAASDSHTYTSVGTFAVRVFAVWIDHDYITHNEVSNTVWVQVVPAVEVLPPPTPTPPRPIPEKPEPPIVEPLEPEPEPPPPCGDLDRQTFHEFWFNWGHQVDKLAFEVPLDDGVDVPDLSEPWRSVWKHLTHHRIDVVFSRKGSIYVAEIKPRLSIAAIGTAIVARTMFMRRYDVSRFDAVKAAVISQVGSPTLIQAAATHRVVVFLTKGIDGLYEPVALHDVIF